jgi:hypothetical protein
MPAALPLTAPERFMDFNYLYHRQQVERMRAAAAACEPSRVAHLDLADAYDDEILRRKDARPEAQTLTC